MKKGITLMVVGFLNIGITISFAASIEEFKEVSCSKIELINQCTQCYKANQINTIDSLSTNFEFNHYSPNDEVYYREEQIGMSIISLSTGNLIKHFTIDNNDFNNSQLSKKFNKNEGSYLLNAYETVNLFEFSENITFDHKTFIQLPYFTHGIKENGDTIIDTIDRSICLSLKQRLSFYDRLDSELVKYSKKIPTNISEKKKFVNIFISKIDSALKKPELSKYFNMLTYVKNEIIKY